MKYLLSNTQFGVYLNTLNLPDYEYRFLRNNFDSFLLRKSEIWMFVPSKLIEGVWVILKLPKESDFIYTFNQANGADTFDGDSYDIAMREYIEAKNKCLFSGDFKTTADLNRYVYFNNVPVLIIGRNIEYFAFFNLDLTKTALKEIGIFNYCKE